MARKPGDSVVWTRVGETCFHARTARVARPDAPKVVLLHGVGVSSRYMLPTLAQLAPFCHVYAPDLPGTGRSSKPRHALDLNEQADALAAWLQAAGVGRITLLANSLGCQAAARFALRHPERLERLILIGPTVDPTARTRLRQVLRLLRAGLREPLSLWPIVLWDYLRFGLRRCLRTLTFAIQDRLEDHLQEIQVPTLVVRGARDTVVPEWWARRVAELLPQGRLAVIPRAAHAVNYDAPRELSRVVRPFLGLQEA
jgi:2-hydroxy-6-oxonona-2,4-dienedioate hydrolase